jgi:hypothetical protein
MTLYCGHIQSDSVVIVGQTSTGDLQHDQATYGLPHVLPVLSGVLMFGTGMAAALAGIQYQVLSQCERLQDLDALRPEFPGMVRQAGESMLFALKMHPDIDKDSKLAQLQADGFEVSLVGYSRSERSMLLTSYHKQQDFEEQLCRPGQVFCKIPDAWLRFREVYGRNPADLDEYTVVMGLMRRMVLEQGFPEAYAGGNVQVTTLTRDHSLEQYEIASMQEAEAMAALTA